MMTLSKLILFPLYFPVAATWKMAVALHVVDKYDSD